MSDYPKYNVGVINGINEVYEVHWLEPDLAEITAEGDKIVAFCSKRDGGFIATYDVLDQANEVVYELENVEDWEEGRDVW